MLFYGKKNERGMTVELAKLLDIRPGVTAVIGSGGKTTLLETLGRELSAAGGSVLLCTTTKIMPFPSILTLTDVEEAALAPALERHGLVCGGTLLADTGKLTALKIPMARLAALAEYVIVEADGSARLPLKAHAPHEPVIPPEANQTICVTGVSGFGLPIAEAAHRPQRFAALAGAAMEDPATPENTARVLAEEGLADRYLFNQADTPERWEWARRAAAALGAPAIIGSLRKGAYRIC